MPPVHQACHMEADPQLSLAGWPYIHGSRGGLEDRPLPLLESYPELGLGVHTEGQRGRSGIRSSASRRSGKPLLFYTEPSDLAST